MIVMIPMKLRILWALLFGVSITSMIPPMVENIEKIVLKEFILESMFKN